MKGTNYKYEYGDRVRITEEAAELICSREPDADFDFNQIGKVTERMSMGKHKMYTVQFNNRSVTLPQTYLEKI